MYGEMFIRDLIRAIPRSGLAKVLSAYLTSELCGFPFHNHEGGTQEEAQEVAMNVSTEDILDEMIVENVDSFANLKEGHALNPNCIVTGRILASYYLYNKDYEAAFETSSSTIGTIRKLQDDTGISITATETTLLVTLATSLIYYQAPKHHPQAQKHFETILSRKPNSVEALVGKGRLALEADEVTKAEIFTSKALQIEPLNVRAKMEHAWATVLLKDIENGKKELEETLPLIDGRDPHSRDIIAEIWWRIGKCYWDEGINWPLLSNLRY